MEKKTKWNNWAPFPHMQVMGMIYRVVQNNPKLTKPITLDVLLRAKEWYLKKASEQN
jgi:hypothetical protein